MSDPQSEAKLIEDVFAPLALRSAGSFNLTDDAAFLAPAPYGLIVTQDQVIEGTHFLPEEPLDRIAQRLVRRNLSDVIGKGGIPVAAFLSIAWPTERARAGLTEFARGLGEDLANLCNHCPLMGGDTSTTSGHLVASLTLLGKPTAPTGQPILRNGAQIGDIVAVTGTIGDSWLGLQARLGKLPKANLIACCQASLAPCPPKLALSEWIGRLAHAAIDVSDGLVLDGERIAKASGIKMILNLDAIPLSQEAQAYVRGADRCERTLKLACGGDDYQPLVTLDPSNFDAYQAAANHLGITVTNIGHCVSGKGIEICFEGQTINPPAQGGWQI